MLFNISEEKKKAMTDLYRLLFPFYEHHRDLSTDLLVDSPLKICLNRPR